MEKPKYGLYSFHEDFGRFEQHIGISQQSAIAAVTQPDSYETVEVEGKIFRHFFTKHVPNNPHGALIVVYGDPLSDEELEIQRAFRIYPDFCENAGTLRPHELLYALANTFGCDITIGSVTQRFFFHQSVIVEDESAPIVRQSDKPNMPDFIKVHWTESINFTYEGGAYRLENDPKTACCLLVFSIDLDKYIGWVKLKEHSPN
jgi:hypothetical protein